MKRGRMLDGMNTAVHEETYGYSYSYGTYSFSGKTTAYFVGNKKTVYVPHTMVYQSKEMAKTIPKRLRTFRYNTYVAKPSAYLSSNVDGAYKTLESNYAKLIKEYEKDLKKIKKEMEAAGYRVQISDDMVMVYSSQGVEMGMGRYTSDYNKLQKELRKDKYLSIHKKGVK